MHKIFILVKQSHTTLGLFCLSGKSKEVNERIIA